MAVQLREFASLRQHFTFTDDIRTGDMNVSFVDPGVHGRAHRAPLFLWPIIHRSVAAPSFL